MRSIVAAIQVSWMDREERISGLLKDRDETAAKLERWGGTEKCRAIVRLFERLYELAEDIEATQDKGKSLFNPAMITRVRMAKKGFELAKDVRYFETDVASEFEKGAITKEAGKRFIAATKLLKENDLRKAKAEFMYFEDIASMLKSHDAFENEIKEDERSLRKEQLKAEKALAEVVDLEKESVDKDKVRRYREFADGMELLKAIRKEYLHSLASKPVAAMISGMEGAEGFRALLPGDDEMAELKKFFSDYPVFAQSDAGKVLRILRIQCEEAVAYLPGDIPLHEGRGREAESVRDIAVSRAHRHPRFGHRAS